jgi:hypothetical protein
MLRVDLFGDPMIQQFINNPDSILRIRQDKFSDELTMQPSLFARAAHLYAQAKQYTNICKMSMEVKYSEVYKTHRADNAEKTCDALVKEDVDYRKSRLNFIEAENQEMVVKALMDGLYQKRDMLQAISGIVKQEMQTGIRVMDEHMWSGSIKRREATGEED